MTGAIIMKSSTKEYVSGWTSLGTPKLTKDKQYAERMLRTAAKRVADNLNDKEHENVYAVV